jgi:hypothetical protein
MPTSNLRGLIVLAISFLCASAFAQAAPAESPLVGSAVVVVGHARLLDAHHHAELAHGAAIVQGDTIETGNDGYVYITTVDQGFISVRPNSSLTVEHYAYDPTAPSRTEIKLALHYGVVREISGKGAQAARDHYRLNTPVAALGVRGTDFSVFTDANVTRAEVRSGGIVMTPLGESCAATGIGPCEGAAAAQLFADQRNVLLQVERGSDHPMVVEAKHLQLIPDQANPALKNEDNAARAATTQSAVQPDVAPAELSFQLTPATTAPPAPSAPAAPSAAPPAPQIFWGRFTPLASLGADTTTSALLQQGSELEAQILPYALTRTPQPDMVMPTSGNFHFNLQNAEAYLVNTSAGTAIPAAISNAMLSIDFGARTFSTSLDLSANGATYLISGHGGVASGSGALNGKLISDYTSAAAIQGALAGNTATQAGYVFSQGVGSKYTAVGATLWSR